MDEDRIYERNKLKLIIGLREGNAFKEMSDKEYMPIIMEQFANPNVRYTRAMISFAMRKIFKR